jgi:hypothetical protein
VMSVRQPLGAPPCADALNAYRRASGKPLWPCRGNCPTTTPHRGCDQAVVTASVSRQPLPSCEEPEQCPLGVHETAPFDAIRCVVPHQDGICGPHEQ